MESNPGEKQTPFVTEEPKGQKGQGKLGGGEELSLRRWQVSFASGLGWYPAGEFIAPDAPSAIERAIEIFGAAAGYRAEEIPWDAAPLPKPNAPSPRSSR